MKPYARIFLTAVKDTAEKSVMVKALLNALFKVHNKDAILITLDRSEDTIKYLVDRICELRTEYLKTVVATEESLKKGEEHGDSGKEEKETKESVKDETESGKETQETDENEGVKSEIARILEESEGNV